MIEEKPLQRESEHGNGINSFSFFMAQLQNYEKHDLSLKKQKVFE